MGEPESGYGWFSRRPGTWSHLRKTCGNGSSENNNLDAVRRGFDACQPTGSWIKTRLGLVCRKFFKILCVMEPSKGWTLLGQAISELAAELGFPHKMLVLQACKAQELQAHRGRTRIHKVQRPDSTDAAPEWADSEAVKVLTAVLMYPMLRIFSLWFHSSLTRSYVSGTYSIVFVNCPNEQIARDIARAILDKKLAASVNILPKTSSLYFWKGEIEESTEILLLIKTKTSKISRLSTYMRLILSQSLIRALLSFQRLAHPFEIPEVFSIPMDPGDARYLKWLEEGMKEN
ncbi:cutA divalent cation tolerance homolog-like [Cricetulus griseus]